MWKSGLRKTIIIDEVVPVAALDQPDMTIFLLMHLYFLLLFLEWGVLRGDMPDLNANIELHVCQCNVCQMSRQLLPPTHGPFLSNSGTVCILILQVPLWIQCFSCLLMRMSLPQISSLLPIQLTNCSTFSLLMVYRTQLLRIMAVHSQVRSYRLSVKWMESSTYSILPLLDRSFQNCTRLQCISKCIQ